MPQEYRAIWTVPGGGTGYSVFHFNGGNPATAAQPIANAIRVFFNALAAHFPDDVQINFDTEVLNLSPAGVLLSVHPVTAPAQVVGTSTAVYQRAGGCRVDWLTGQIVGGRRLTGRTYLVPIQSTDFTTTGQIIASMITLVESAASTLITTTNAFANIAVWSRTHQVVHDVTGRNVPESGSVLRSRRD